MYGKLAKNFPAAANVHRLRYPGGTLLRTTPLVFRQRPFFSVNIYRETPDTPVTYSNTFFFLLLFSFLSKRLSEYTLFTRIIVIIIVYTRLEENDDDEDDDHFDRQPRYRTPKAIYIFQQFSFLVFFFFHFFTHIN